MHKSIFTFTMFALLFTSNAYGRSNPRYMDPSMTDYISTLGLANPQSYDRFNMLLVAYDNPTVPRSRSLTSRSDVMMVISFDKANRKIDIISVGRDFRPNPGCHFRAGRSRKSGDTGLINAASIVYNRKAMIDCISSVMGEFLGNIGAAGEFEVEGGYLPIHSVYEAQRGENADESVVGRLVDSVWGNFSSALSLIGTYSDALFTMNNIAGRYNIIFNGLKRRDYPRSGSYQRALNNAKFIADALGWAAPGVQSTKEEGYNFLTTDIFHPVDEIMSSTHTLAQLNNLLSYYEDGSDIASDNMFRYGAFYMNPNKTEATRENEFGPDDAVSPVRVIQIGSTTRSYAVYHRGELDVAPAEDNFTRALVVRPVFHRPGESTQLCPDCAIIPELGSGSWGTQAPLQ